MSSCVSCGAELPPGARFCSSCGTSVSGAREMRKVIICETCGSENEPGAKFCTSCGSKLSGEVTMVEVEPEAVKKVELGKAKKVKKAPKRRTKFSFNTIFFASVSVLILALLGYGIFIKKKAPESAPDVSTTQEQNILSEINRLEEHVNKNPDDLNSMLLLANMLQDAHFFERAIKYYRKYLSKRSDDVNARGDLGVCLFQLGRFDEAIAEMKKALEFDPKHQIILFNLGIVYLSQGNVDEANKYFKKCIDVDPNTDLAQRARKIMEQHNF